MKDQELLALYVGLTPFLSTILGEGCEVVVHDLKDPNRSIVAIENNLSGRKIGDPMTDLPLERAGKEDFVANYPGRGKGKEFLSSSFFIKNEGRVIGLLCVNKDVGYVHEIHHQVCALLERFNLLPPTGEEIRENLDGSVEEIMRRKIEEAILQTGIPPSRMSLEEKRAVTQRLKESGVLSMRGAVNELAEQLSVSVPTVYRYMAK